MSVRPTSRAASCMRLASAAESPDSNNCDKAWPPLPWQPPGPPEPVAVWFLGLCSGGSCAGVASAPGWTFGVGNFAVQQLQAHGLLDLLGVEAFLREEPDVGQAHLARGFLHALGQRR